MDFIDITRAIIGTNEDYIYGNLDGYTFNISDGGIWKGIRDDTVSVAENKEIVVSSADTISSIFVSLVGDDKNSDNPNESSIYGNILNIKKQMYGENGSYANPSVGTTLYDINKISSDMYLGIDGNGTIDNPSDNTIFKNITDIDNSLFGNSVTGESNSSSVYSIVNKIKDELYGEVDSNGVPIINDDTNTVYKRIFDQNEFSHNLSIELYGENGTVNNPTSESLVYELRTSRDIIVGNGTATSPESGSAMSTMLDIKNAIFVDDIVDSSIKVNNGSLYGNVSKIKDDLYGVLDVNGKPMSGTIYGNIIHIADSMYGSDINNPDEGTVLYKVKHIDTDDLTIVSNNGNNINVVSDSITDINNIGNIVSSDSNYIEAVGIDILDNDTSNIIKIASNISAINNVSEIKDSVETLSNMIVGPEEDNYLKLIDEDLRYAYDDDDDTHSILIEVGTYIPDIVPAAKAIAQFMEEDDDGVSNLDKIEVITDDLSKDDDESYLKRIIPALDDIKNVNTFVSGDNFTKVIAVEDKLDTSIDTLYTNIDKIDTLYDNSDSLSSIHNNIDKIITVDSNKDNIATVFDNINNITTLSNNSTEMIIVSNSIDSVNNVSSNIENIDKINNDIEKINNVSENMSKISDVSEIKEQVKEVIDNRFKIEELYLDLSGLRENTIYGGSINNPITETIEGCPVTEDCDSERDFGLITTPIIAGKSAISEVARGMDKLELLYEIKDDIDALVEGDNLAYLQVLSDDVNKDSDGDDDTYSSVMATGDNIASVNTVAANIENVNTVSTNIDGVKVIASDILKKDDEDDDTVSSIFTVVDNIASINIATTYIDNINSVAEIAENIEDLDNRLSDALTEADSNATVSKDNADKAKEYRNEADSARDASVAAKEETFTARDEAVTAKDESISAKDEALTYRDDSNNIFHSINQLLLSPKDEDPDESDDGSGLEEGMQYFNTHDDVMKVYDGSDWKVGYADVDDAMMGDNNLSDVSDEVASRKNIGLEIDVDVQSYNEDTLIFDDNAVIDFGEM